MTAAMQETGECLVKGGRFWYSSNKSTWTAAEVKHLNDGACTLQLEGGEVVTVSNRAIVPANPTVQDGIQELTHLTYLNEPSILFNFQHRYSSDQIYTFAGPVLVALNPCKELPLYTDDVAARYKGQAAFM